MIIHGWKYYNHAAIPTCEPHEMPNLEPIKDGSIWKMDGKPLLARWTEEYDCGYETSWWYCVLDKPFDIAKLKANRRYKIKKGNRLFEVREIEPLDYAEDLLRVQKAAFSAYPRKYRPRVNEDEFNKYLVYYSQDIRQGGSIFYGAFYNETNELCGYHIVTIGRGYKECNVLKTNPEFEKYQINAALVYKWVMDSEDLLKSGGYIADGTRTINHETAFQDYLEYYFGFRKAYCKLWIKYRPLMHKIVALLYPLRKIIVKMDAVGFIHQINAVLMMEEYARLCNSGGEEC